MVCQVEKIVFKCLLQKHNRRRFGVESRVRVLNLFDNLAQKSLKRNCCGPICLVFTRGGRKPFCRRVGSNARFRSKKRFYKVGILYHGHFRCKNLVKSKKSPYFQMFKISGGNQKNLHFHSLFSFTKSFISSQQKNSLQIYHFNTVSHYLCIIFFNCYTLVICHKF